MSSPPDALHSKGSALDALLKDVRRWLWLWAGSQLHSSKYLYSWAVTAMILATALIGIFEKQSVNAGFIVLLGVVLCSYPAQSLMKLFLEAHNVPASRLWPRPLPGQWLLLAMTGVSSIVVLLLICRSHAPGPTLVLLGATSFLGAIDILTMMLCLLAMTSVLFWAIFGVPAVPAGWLDAGLGACLFLFALNDWRLIRRIWYGDWAARRALTSFSSNRDADRRAGPAWHRGCIRRNSADVAHALSYEWIGRFSRRSIPVVWMMAMAVCLAGAGLVFHLARNAGGLAHSGTLAFFAVYGLAMISWIFGSSLGVTGLRPGRLSPVSRVLLAHALYRVHVRRTAKFILAMAAATLIAWIAFLHADAAAAQLPQVLLCTVTASLPMICLQQAICVQSAPNTLAYYVAGGTRSAIRRRSASILGLDLAMLAVSALLSLAVLESGLWLALAISVATVPISEYGLAWWINRYFRNADLVDVRAV